jgi:hypothetical protein
MLMRALAATVCLVTVASCDVNTDPQPTLQITPGVSASFEGQSVAHALGASIALRPGATEDTTLAPSITWSMVGAAPGVSVDATGLVTVSPSATAGDYAVRATAEGAAATATIRVLPRTTGYMIFVSLVGSDYQVFIRDFSNDSASRQLTSAPGFIGGLAADGATKSIFFARGPPPSVDIFRIQFDGTGLVNLTNDPARANQGPAVDTVTHDIFFSRIVGGVQQIVRMRPDGSALATVTGGVQNKLNPGVSPDGKYLAWGESYQPGFNQEIVTSRTTGEDTVRFTNRAGLDGLPVWLTNSRVLWLQFGTTSGLYVATAPWGSDVMSATSSSASISSPGRGCTTNTFTYIHSAGGRTHAVQGELETSVLVKFGLGRTPTLVRRVC